MAIVPLIYWIFVLFGLMWLGIVVGYRGLVRMLRERADAEAKGEQTWTIGL